MLLALFDPVLLLIAAPVFFYFVCLSVALAGWFPPSHAGARRKSQQADTQLKASLRRYAAWRPEPLGGEVWLSHPSRIARGIHWVKRRFSRAPEPVVIGILSPNAPYEAHRQISEQVVKSRSNRASHARSQAERDSAPGAGPFQNLPVQPNLFRVTDREAS